MAQIELTGKVKDSLNQPIELANILLVNSNSKKIIYGTSNQDGFFKLLIDEKGNYKVKISYVGMKTLEKDLIISNSNIYEEFILSNDNSLDEIEIIYEMPIRVVGDTLIYNTDSFTSGTERKLKDVLKKLPGVEVDKNGQVKLNGKQISNTTVEDKKIFGGDSKIPVENIPANVIDKIEFLQNYSENEQLNGLTNNQNSLSMNIKLKEDKKKFWFGNLVSGIGEINRKISYLSESRLFYFSPKFSLNLIGNLMNVGGVSSFSRDDFYRLSNLKLNSIKHVATNLNYQNNSLKFDRLMNDNAQSYTSKFGAIDLNFVPNKSFEINTYGILSHSNTQIQESKSIKYTDPNLSNVIEDIENRTTQNIDMGLVNLFLKYKPNHRNQLDYNINARMSKEVQEKNNTSSFLGSSKQTSEAKPYRISQNFNYYYTLNDNNIFASRFHHLIQNEDPFYNALVENTNSYTATANNLGLDIDQLSYNVNQERKVKTNVFDLRLDYWNIINQKSNLNITYGAIFSTQNFKSDFFQLLDDESVFNPVPIINNGINTNRVNYFFNNYYLALRYKLKVGSLTVSPIISYNLFSNKTEQINTISKNNIEKFLPGLDLKLDLGSAGHVSLDYKISLNYIDATKFARGIVLNNYNSIFIGNEELSNVTSHNLNFSYTNINRFRSTNIYSFFSYRKSIDNLSYNSNFNNVVSTSNIINSPFVDESLIMSSSFRKRFGKLWAGVKYDFSYLFSNQFIEDNRVTNKRIGNSFNFDVYSNFKNFPNFTLSYLLNVSNNKQGEVSNTFITKSPSVKIEADLWNKIKIDTDYSYNNFQDNDKSINNSFEFWNASISYKRNDSSSLEYSIVANNILNTSFLSNNRVTPFSLITSSYFIQPRVFTFRIQYDF